MKQSVNTLSTFTQASKAKRPDEYALNNYNRTKSKQGIERTIAQFHLSEELKKVPGLPERGATTHAVDRELEIATQLIRNGRNVCFHGYGSKDSDMGRVVAELDRTHHVFFVRGYYNDFMPRTLYIKMIEYVRELGIKKGKKATDFHGDAEDLSQQLYDAINSMPKTLLCLVFCGLDGPNFLRTPILNGLARLAQLANFRLLASVDSPCFAHFLSRVSADQFNFIYIPFHTAKPYVSELLYLDSNTRESSVKKSQDTLAKFFTSLTANQRELVFFVLHELLRSDKAQVEEQELFARAVADAKVTSFTQFQENLKEALFHKILEVKVVDKYSRVYRTFYEKHELEEILDTGAANGQDEANSSGLSDSSAD